MAPEGGVLPHLVPYDVSLWSLAGGRDCPCGLKSDIVGAALLHRPALESTHQALKTEFPGVSAVRPFMELDKGYRPDDFAGDQRGTECPR